ncbi:hypothetical protein [Klebsiella michiganensis]|uniref:hypothetical protein n=1 Tax=Klebsiella michiganensis TaxID=1134687 RepID=UPI003EE286EE
MPNHHSASIDIGANSDWLTINEAVTILNHNSTYKISDSDIYRKALYGKITLSIYFQSPFIARRVKKSHDKLTLRCLDASLTKRICFLDSISFLYDKNLVFSTEGNYIYPTQRIVDTPLLGNEYVAIQRLLALSLKMTPPLKGAREANYGTLIRIGDSTFQIFEKKLWQERLKEQLNRLHDNTGASIDIYKQLPKDNLLFKHAYFPIHFLPRDASFVIRVAELEKLTKSYLKQNPVPLPSTRISTPLSRLFWLACKHNESINSLITKPYKLLSIFEKWAKDDGITDRLSADTLKAALERGSPH